LQFFQQQFLNQKDIGIHWCEVKRIANEDSLRTLIFSDGDSEPPDPGAPYGTGGPGTEADITERRSSSHILHQTQSGQHPYSHDDLSEVSSYLPVFSDYQLI
jgi:hypothetical protein